MVLEPESEVFGIKVFGVDFPVKDEED